MIRDFSAASSHNSLTPCMMLVVPQHLPADNTSMTSSFEPKFQLAIIIEVSFEFTETASEEPCDPSYSCSVLLNNANWFEDGKNWYYHVLHILLANYLQHRRLYAYLRRKFEILVMATLLWSE
ncbi:uncharacterized protein BDCG_16515 [Blastomyces dermatitidis ER-3]|uniref:Uncharacterized protein n=1 Tax=Ajellomyces dermatitidis (strain ER-3 / ATCC MYA-2586) TaxID=559297 RepID=A0ABX2VSM1_AJEDR|nr:uncharacterized protein BDCG_16515 [Blastomyces dermatitidis ER-3]OAT00215.1 hypothetical protein BDCG_16515 [Blastomyces dermatitidis ER-3]